MHINLLRLNNGAAKATGIAIIIDVFRAFSVECFLINNGAKRIYPVGSIEMAYKMKMENPDYLLMGERHEKICESFDFGNSPTHIADRDFTGKTIVHTTSSGTQGIDLATEATEIFTGSFVNAGAIVKYMRMINPEEVSLVAMGYEGLYPTQEDDFCAEYIANELSGKPTDYPQMVELIRKGDGARLLDPKNHAHSPATDFDLCLGLNRFNFVLKVRKDELGRNYIERIDVD